MANHDTSSLLSEIEVFLTATGMGATYFGKKAANDSALVARLRAGTTPKGKTVIVRPEVQASVRKFMRAEAKRRQTADMARAS